MILIVEDDLEIIKNLTELLNEENFRVISVSRKDEVEKMLKKYSFDLVILDILLPDESGYSICSMIKKNKDVPIILLTAMSDEYSIATGFSVGADDYISKPFKPIELIARIRNLLRRYKKNTIVEISNLKIDTETGSVYKNNKEIALSALEYKLLLFFINHQNQLITREKLLNDIWDVCCEYVSDNTLTVYIKRLRKKIEDDPINPKIIQTIRGRGYKLGDNSESF